MSRPRKFWEWFVGRDLDHAGWKQLFNWWLVLHGAVGVALALVVPRSIVEIGQTVVLPLAGVLVALSFAWVGTALAIVQTDEIGRLAEESGLGLEAYVYTFQLAVLVLLACVSLWTIGALGVFDQTCVWECSWVPYVAGKAVLLSLLSVAVRECWQVVAGVQMLVLFGRAVRAIKKPE